MMRRFDIACLAAISAPLVAGSALLFLVAAGERLGATPFAGLVPANSAEAAGMGSAVHLIRFLRMAEDPTRVYPVRPEIISSAVLKATTLEAAMWSRQIELVQLLDREGAIVGDQRRRELACLAADLRVEDVAEYLSPEGVAYCDAGKAFGRVLARTSGEVAAR
jgi:hypothetical protein